MKNWNYEKKIDKIVKERRNNENIDNQEIYFKSI